MKRVLAVAALALFAAAAIAGPGIDGVPIGAYEPSTGAFSTLSTSGRTLGAQGADVASAGCVSLGYDGNFFNITPGATVQRLSSVGWTPGSVVVLLFTDPVNVQSNQVNAVTCRGINLKGAASWLTTRGATLTLIFDGNTNQWYELARSSN